VIKTSNSDFQAGQYDTVGKVLGAEALKILSSEEYLRFEDSFLRENWFNHSLWFWQTFY